MQLTGGTQVQGRVLEPISRDPSRWIGSRRLGSGARGVNGPTVGVASSMAMKSLETRQAQPPGGLKSLELPRTGEWGSANSMAGFGCENVTGGAPGGLGLLRQAILAAGRGNRVRQGWHQLR
jgi:hypothetical protein